MNLSVVIVAQNEEPTIGLVLKSVAAIADEIILVDSGSSDRTVEIAQQYKVQVHHQKWLGYADQKNFALDLAKNEWVLSLDADEILSANLAAELKELMESPYLKQFAGYRIPRILFIGEQRLTHGGFYPDAQLRLFQKDRGRFNKRLVHEAVFVDGAVGKLKNPLLHLAYENLVEYKEAMEKYARLSAQEFVGRVTQPTSAAAWFRASRLNELIHPMWTFFLRYIMRGGFLDGSIGWRANLIHADYVRKKIRYFRELRATLT